MLEEPGSDAPVPQRAEPVPEPPGRRRWSDRKALIVRFAIGIVVTVAIGTGAAIAARPARPAPQRLAYTRLPPACDLVTAAHLAKYLPGATGSPKTSSSATKRDGSCFWFNEAATMNVQAQLFDSSTGVTQARQAYEDYLHSTCNCRGAKITTTSQGMTGLGDQAAALLITLPASTLKYHAAWIVPQIILVARSGNAVITLILDVQAPSPPAPPRPTDASLLAQTVSMVHDVLAALARPAAVAAVPLAVPSPSPPQVGPRYGNPSSACALVKTATLARYAPGATAKRLTMVYPAVSCQWNAPDADIILTVTLNADSGSAQQFFGIAVTQDATNGNGTKVEGRKQIKGLGQQATAIFETEIVNLPAVDLVVWSGNAVIDINVSDQLFEPLLSRAAKLAAAEAVARDVMADLPR